MQTDIMQLTVVFRNPENAPNKQSRTDDNGWPFGFVVRFG